MKLQDIPRIDLFSLTLINYTFLSLHCDIYNTPATVFAEVLFDQYKKGQVVSTKEKTNYNVILYRNNLPRLSHPRNRRQELFCRDFFFYNLHDVHNEEMIKKKSR